jgi:hypothetical protein
VIKRVVALFIVAVIAGTVLVTGNVSTEAAPNINLTLTISPKQGGPGTNITTKVSPGQAQSVCLNSAEATAQLRGFATQLLANPAALSVDSTAALTAASAGTLHSVAALYSVAFADIATQQPVSENTPGWDPVSGQGSIAAPNAKRPQAYAVAVVCLGLKAPTAAQASSALSGANPAAPDAAMERLLRVAIDDDPIGTGFAIFCLTDGGACGSVSAVVAQPRTTG